MACKFENNKRFYAYMHNPALIGMNFLLQGKQPITVNSGTEVVITKKVRDWRADYLKKQVVDGSKKGRPPKEIANSPEYKVFKIWQETLLFKYKAYKEGAGDQFNEGVWQKWLSRFTSNMDKTNEMFLQCVEGLQKGEVCFTCSPDVPFVSLFLILLNLKC